MSEERFEASDDLPPASAILLCRVASRQSLVLQNQVAVTVGSHKEFDGHQRWQEVGVLCAPGERQLGRPIDDRKFAPVLVGGRGAPHDHAQRPPDAWIKIDGGGDDVPGTHP